MKKSVGMFLLGLMICVVAFAQDDGVEYRQPFDFPVLFAGNFGEIRANHFHAGLDFKTQGVVGKAVKAQADGYVSRIRVNTGSGYVLNVTYENGYYLIYRHLDAFVGDIAQRVKDYQYEHEQWEVDITPDRDEYPVKAGQIIAIGGNTGYSTGPHLHLDMVEIETDEFVDPLPFFQKDVKDHTAPTPEGFMVIPQKHLGVVDGSVLPKTYAVKQTPAITAWGKIGVALKAYDHMEGAANRYGVKHLLLTVDGNEVFRSDVDRFAESEHRYINSWTEGQYMKSFIEPGNHLRMIKALNGDRGLITIDEERPYQLVYTLTDGMGNTSKVSFVIQGKRQDIPTSQADDRFAFKWDKVNALQQPGIDLVVPKNCLYDDVDLDFKISGGGNDVAYVYQLTKSQISLHRRAELKIGVLNMPVADTSKYYMARIDSRGRKHACGGEWKDGFVVADILMLGTYTVAVDTVAPQIIPVEARRWGTTGRVVLKLKDDGSDVKSYRGTIDGQYALFGMYNSYKGNIECILDPDHVAKGQTHTLEFWVTDNCGNETTQTMEFTW